MLGCAAGAPRRVATPVATTDPIARYDVRWDPERGELAVEARLAPEAGATFRVDPASFEFVRAVETSPDGRVLRYRYALRDAARAIDDVDVASEEGAVLEAPPSTWIVPPEGAVRSARVRIRVSTPSGSSFATGLFASARERGAWDVTLDDLGSSPYSAFGPMRIHEVPVRGGRVELAIAEGELRVSDDELVAWVRACADAVATYFDRFPLPSALVLVVPARGGWVGGGRSLAGGGGTSFLRIGRRATKDSLAEDWVLVHEMIHLAFPSVPRAAHWAEEGLATYVEPFARTRAGGLSAEDAWRGLVRGLPNGLPGPRDRGLDRTPTWGRTYWGGALFYLLADVEIRKRTENRRGLEHALRGILAAGGSGAVRWPLDATFARADAAIGMDVLGELHREMGASPHPVDLDALFDALGVSLDGDEVRFDDDAPLAAIRRAITSGNGSDATSCRTLCALTRREQWHVLGRFCCGSNGAGANVPPFPIGSRSWTRFRR